MPKAAFVTNQHPPLPAQVLGEPIASRINGLESSEVYFKRAVLAQRAALLLAKLDQPTSVQVPARAQFLRECYKQYRTSCLKNLPFRGREQLLREASDWLNQLKPDQNKKWLEELDQAVETNSLELAGIAPSWKNALKYRSLLGFYELGFPQALALPKAENTQLHSIVVGINQALAALHAGKEDNQKCTPDLANQLEVLNKKMDELRAYFAANQHYNSATRRALFHGDQYDEFLAQAKEIDTHFNTSWNKASQLLFTTHPRKPSSLPDDENTKAADLEANKQKFFANTPDGSLDDFEVTYEVLQKAVADFKERHGEKSIKLNVKNGHFDVTFSPPATGVLYASYSEYANFQRHFVKLLKQRAEEAKPNPNIEVYADEPGAVPPGQRGEGGHIPSQAGADGPGLGPTGKPLGAGF